MAKRQDAEPTAKPRNDAYTGMLIISLGAMILGGALLYVDYSRYPSNMPKELPKAPATGKDIANVQPGGEQPAGVVPPPPGPVVPPPAPKDKDAAPKDKDAAPKDKDAAGKDKAPAPKDKEAAPKDKDKAPAKDKEEPKDKDKNKDKEKDK